MGYLSVYEAMQETMDIRHIEDLNVFHPNQNLEYIFQYKSYKNVLHYLHKNGFKSCQTQ